MGIRHGEPIAKRHRGYIRVRWQGKEYQCGPWSESASWERFEDLKARLLERAGQVASGTSLAALVTGYIRYADAYYRTAAGAPTKETTDVRRVLTLLTEFAPNLPASQFDQRQLKAFRETLIASGWARPTINKAIGRVRRAFRWAAEEQLIDVSVWQALATVSPLKRGRCAARDCPDVQPVPDETIEATLKHLKPIHAAIVRFQRLTGCRPAEVCGARVGEIDRSTPIWFYRPTHHKTAWRGRSRAIAIGPRLQELLAPLLDGKPADARLFELSRNAYLKAVKRACKKAKVAEWCPAQIRHTFATVIAREFGIIAASQMLGHSRADVTQIYASRTEADAAELARKVG